MDILLTVPTNNLVGLRKIAASITGQLSLRHDVTVSMAIKPTTQLKRCGDTPPYFRSVLKEGLAYEQ